MTRRIRLFVPTALLLAACMEPDVRIIHLEPLWMEWPAEARAGVPFDVHLVGYGPGCYPQQDLRIDVEPFDSGVAFRTLWLVEGENNGLCDVVLIDVGFYDTTVTVGGLAATAVRTYEIWSVNANSPPFTRMGTIVVRPTDPVATNRINAGGWVHGFTDVEGCAVMQRNFEAPIPVENPPAATWQGFVRGYFFTPAAPLCGQTRAFHVEDAP